MEEIRDSLNQHSADGCAHLTGFNYQPSWGYNGLTVWGENFNGHKYFEELNRGKTYFPRFNLVRTWLSWSAFKENSTRFTKNFDQAIEISGSLGLLVIPVLFTRWGGEPPFDPVRDTDILGVDFQEQFGPFIDTVVRSHLGDPRILAWDLCNEPEVHAETPKWLDLHKPAFDAFHRFHISQPAGFAQFQWLKFVFERVKGADSSALTCAGTLADYGVGELLEPMSDILTPHLYGYPPYELVRKHQPELRFADFFEDMVSDYVAYAKRVGKPAISSETCWPPGFGADSAARVECMRVTLGTLQRYKIGFAAHALYASGVADLHDPAANLGGAYMGFINLDGSLREGHEAFNDYC